jgi:TolA-binding protein
MGAARKKADEAWKDTPKRRPAVSREARQARLENLALDLIEERFLDKTASSQETTLFARSASTRGRIEELRLEHEIELMKAKKAQIESQEELQTMFKDAIAAMGNYRLEGPDDIQDLPGAH